ncbi:predicted protein [Aspergillus terreus NIH2624]|uniref:Uncharacterized protein n=1 Tax=Aspergillus terreus (strain NIH 2624 / FGSC A1156) TaxID=341663 RepID=Q0CZM7_ASPTN|nr:uncharacterized protein ATEG_00857 [Aspergillus terreus NIH2624]EAU39503.1 predicted protein [Aspergillus terreus NIH2624]
MGQRHNRRRTRPRSRNRSVNTAPFDSSLNPAVSEICDSPDSIPNPIAPTWHFGQTVWQAREHTLQLEAEQCRLFGGEPGDDIGLCYRMLEYFGGLDYIDSPHSLKSMPG